MRSTTPLETRFWPKVQFPRDPDDCWNWGAALRNGYGVIGLGGREEGIEYAHRLSYMFAHEFIPDGLEICHTCDNRRCVNPKHMYAGSRSDNMLDASRRGRIRNQYSESQALRPG